MLDHILNIILEGWLVLALARYVFKGTPFVIISDDTPQKHTYTNKMDSTTGTNNPDLSQFNA